MNNFNKFPESKKIRGFENVRKYLSTIPNIACGGCGVAAIAMYRWLVMRGFNENSLSIIMGHNRVGSFLKNSEAYGTTKDLPFACTHVGLIIQYEKNDMVVDCMYRWYFNSYKYAQIVDESALISSLNNLEDWNSDFDRGEYIPQIEKKLNINLSDIKIKQYAIF